MCFLHFKYFFFIKLLSFSDTQSPQSVILVVEVEVQCFCMLTDRVQEKATGEFLHNKTTADLAHLKDVEVDHAVLTVIETILQEIEGNFRNSVDLLLRN